MRAISLFELALLARVLSPAPAAKRRQIAKRILSEVGIAANHLLENGRSHPEFGDGSLMSRCPTLSPRAEPFADDEAFLASLIVSCKALFDHSKM